jgi:type IV secretory pathway VirB2 component (pilin)
MKKMSKLLSVVLVVAMAVLFTSFSWRKLAVIIGAVVGVLVCAALLSALFPGFAGWFSCWAAPHPWGIWRSLWVMG